jgi:hypothetical protein
MTTEERLDRMENAVYVLALLLKDKAAEPADQNEPAAAVLWEKLEDDFLRSYSGG